MSTEETIVPVALALQQQVVDTIHVDPVVLDGLQRVEHRMFVLKINHDLEMLLNHPRQNFVEYTNMNSYERLIVHRVADHYHMNHIPDKVRMGVTVYRTPQSKMPEKNLKEVPGPLNVDPITGEKTDDVQAPQQPFKIIQRGLRKSENANGHAHNGQPRKHNTVDIGNGQYSQGVVMNSNAQPFNKSAKTFRSFEEKEAAYQQARARIFQESVTSPQAMESSGSIDAENGQAPPQGSTRPKNFVPRVQSSQPRPRYSNMSMTFNNPNGMSNAAPAGPAAMNGYAPYVYNPAMMPYLYPQGGDVVGAPQVGALPANGIYVDPYTGAQYLIAMPPEYFDHNAAVSASAIKSAPIVSPSQEEAKPASVMAKSPIVKQQHSPIAVTPDMQMPVSPIMTSTTAANRLPLQFGSLKITGESSSAVMFKEMK